MSIEADCRIRPNERCFSYERCWSENRCAFNDVGRYLPLPEDGDEMRTTYRRCPKKCEPPEPCPTCGGTGQVLSVDMETSVPATWPIFVFGSNRQGVHGAGAAAFALRHRGAVPGQGEGQFGHSYALPTRSYDPRDGFATLPIEEIREHVERFLAYARRRTKDRFFVTALGTGFAGLSHQDIAPLFREIPDNVIIPEEWEALNVRLGK